jgi:hypothetical protein
MENCIGICLEISKKAFAKNFPRAPRGSPREFKNFKKVKFSSAKHLSIEKMTLILKMIIFVRLLLNSAQETFKTRKVREKMNF